MRPDYTSYTNDELEDAYNSIDKDSFPDRAEALRLELHNRLKRGSDAQHDERVFYTWKSTARNKFFTFFFMILAIISLGDALDGDISSIIVFIVSFVFFVFYLRMLKKKSGWLTLNEEGVSYESTSGLRKIKWREIRGCKVQHMRFTKYATLKLLNGGQEILPIFGEKAEEVSRAIINIAKKKNAPKNELA